MDYLDDQWLLYLVDKIHMSIGMVKVSQTIGYLLDVFSDYGQQG